MFLSTPKTSSVVNVSQISHMLNLFTPNPIPLPRTATISIDRKMYPKKTITSGIIALKSSAVMMSPCINAWNPRVIPHPGQANPVIV